MKSLLAYFSYPATIAALLLLVACSGEDSVANAPAASAALDVYKSPTCMCCQEWAKHVEEAGFATTTHHPDDLNQVKANYGIAPRFQSCHTAVSQQGYVFEGHVPARYILQFLANPPAGALGLSVPGMPVGSPGMEMGDRFMPYEVVLLKKDGSSEVYAAVSSPEQQ